jgi:hypothetical protein
MNQMCEQVCGTVATVYAVDPYPDGWGGHYCEPCAVALGFRVVDRYPVCRDCGTGDGLRRVMLSNGSTPGGWDHVTLCGCCTDTVARRGRQSTISLGAVTA